MKRMHIKIFFSLFLFFGNSFLQAKVEASLDLEEAFVGDELRLSLIIDGKLDKEVEFPLIPGLDVIGQNQASNFSSINGVVKRQVIFVYVLVAQKPGKYTIPAIGAQILGKIYKSKPIQVVIKAPSNQVSPGSPSKGDEQQVPLNFIQRSFSKQEAFVGEPIVSTTKFYFRSEVSNIRSLLSKSNSFRFIDFQGEKKKEYYKEILYDVVTFKRVLIPLKSGDLSLEPDGMRVDFAVERKQGERGYRDPFNSFFGQSHYKIISKTLVTKKSQLKIKPIPLKGRLNNYRGMIGDFTVKSELTTKKLKVGETTTLTITIEGFGLLDGAKVPDLNLPKSVKVYADKPELKEGKHPDKGVYSRKVYKFALVPTKEGEIDLGKYEESFFSPEKKTFAYLSSELGKIFVDPGEQRAVVRSSPEPIDKDKLEVKATGTDLIDIKRNLKLLRKSGDSGFTKILSYLVWFLLFVYLFLLGSKKFHLFSPKMTAKRRKKKAYTLYKNKRKVLLSLIASADKKSLAQQYSQLIREYLGNKLDLKGLSLTTADVTKALEGRGLQADLKNEIINLMKSIDKVSFSSHAADLETHKKNIEAIDHLVKKVESYV